MPVDPLFILSIIDFFQVKCDEGTRVHYFSDSAGPLISIANVNVDFLNEKLQDKIYNTDNPFDFEKMKEAGTFNHFKDITEYKDYIAGNQRNNSGNFGG